MAFHFFPQAHQSPPALAGAWKLMGGLALTLQPREPGVLRVKRGSLWATGDGPHSGPLNHQGDLFLQAGEQLRLRRGQRVVIEAWNRLGPAYFSWDPLPQPVAAAWRTADLAQPVEDLRLAMGLGARAAGRLLAALAGLGLAWLGRPPSLEACAFSAHSSA